MLFLDFLLLTLIIICVVYCWMLNRRIQDLQNSRIEFARMIKELNASIIKAENNVNEMSELSKITGAEIKAVVEEAKDSGTELINACNIASELSATLMAQAESMSEGDNTSYENSMSSKSGERFTADDLAPPEEEASYTNHLKNFIQNIVTKRDDEPSSSLNQMSYYDTLRKINAKK